MTGAPVSLRALLIAPPGAGKGTQAERLSAHFHVSNVSTGDVFRREVQAGTAIGVQVKAYLDAGDLVPDGLVGEIVRREIERAIAETGGYLLDGFPRTLPQAEAVYAFASELGITAHAVLTFDVPRDVLLKRLLGRGSKGDRSDDEEATILHRLDVYDAQTAPLLDYYASRGLLVRIVATQPIDAVTAASVVALEAALARAAPTG